MISASRATRYLVGLGSNRCHRRHGRPVAIIAAAADALAAEGLEVVATSAVLRTRPLGPSHRQYANAAVLVRTILAPPALLILLKRIERAFGRRRGRRWGSRVLDLDILAWSLGAWPPAPRRAAPFDLAIPHRALPVRDFALEPAAALAPGWRHPHLRATLRQLERRRARPRPVDRRASGQ